LIHRTNYEGRQIVASKSRPHRDLDVKGLKVVWTQFSTSRRNATCCWSFGSRRIFVRKRAFVHSKDKSIWKLYLVRQNVGNNERHYFYKFVVIPSGTPSFGKKTCTQQFGWKFCGSLWVDSDDAGSSPLEQLNILLRPYYQGEEHYDGDGDGDIYRFHVHVGLCMEGLMA